jgi:hypothetical protein
VAVPEHAKLKESKGKRSQFKDALPARHSIRFVHRQRIILHGNVIHYRFSVAAVP